MTLLLNNFKWITLLIILIGLTTSAIKWDFTNYALTGDQASHALQALSIAYDFDLKFDKNDEKHWKELGWNKTPDGLFFQKYSDGYAFSKPYAYSLFTSLFVATFDKKGFIIGNLSILILLGVFIYLTLAKYYSANISIGLSTAFCVFSYTYMYVFTIHSDLFLALLIAIYIYFIATLFEKKNSYLYYLLPVLLALLIADKITMLLVVAPITIYAIKDKSIKDMVIFSTIFILSFLIFIMPYLYYSDFNSWNPYSGVRLYASHAPPLFFENHDIDGSISASGQSYFKLEYLLDNVFNLPELKNKLLSSYYYFFGAYTGMLAFTPISFIIIFAAIYRSIKHFDIRIALTLTGMLLYISFYITLFSFNYYGGTQSLGNRYFLQISPIIILLLFMLKLDKWKCQLVIASSLLLTIIFIPHHHEHPNIAYNNIFKSGYIQSTMPFEITQTSLVQHFPNTQKVNLDFFPIDPSFYKAEKNSFAYNQDKDELVKHNKAFIKDDISLFRYEPLNGNNTLVDHGFHRSEKTHIWSRKKSKILIPNNGQVVNIIINSFIPKNKIIITANDELYEFLLDKEGMLSIDMKELKRKWLEIHFSAEKSAKPSERNSKSHDSRTISFNISINENARIDVGKQ